MAGEGGPPKIDPLNVVSHELESIHSHKTTKIIYIKSLRNILSNYDSNSDNFPNVQIVDKKATIRKSEPIPDSFTVRCS